MSYKKHALREFELIGYLKDGVYKNKAIEDLCERNLSALSVISQQSHSGISWSFFYPILKNVIRSTFGQDWKESLENSILEEIKKNN